MAALGEQPEALAVPELAEADGAVGAVHEPVAALVLAHRDLVDQRLVQPVRRHGAPRLLTPRAAATAAAAAIAIFLLLLLLLAVKQSIPQTA